VNEFIRVTRPIWPVSAILAAAALWLSFGPSLPIEYRGLRTIGPYAALGIALGLAWWFNRGRSFVLVGSLLAAWAGYEYSLEHGAMTVKTIYTAFAVLVPLNALAALVENERGARHGPGYRWITIIAAEVLIVVWIGVGGKTEIGDQAWEALFEHWAFRSPPTPLAGRLLFGAAFAAAVWRAYPDHTALQIGNAGALAAFFIAAEWGVSPPVFSGFMTAAGVILIVALLQESHALAFRDELTGLPGRRALEERLRSLPARYVIAMVDVDHFKQFNDTHGHDVGDQVLKLVGGRLAQVGGGGMAYRYGGEEFAVLFPERELEEALLHLEAIRGSIERYRMAVRGEDRPKNPEEAAKLRGTRPEPPVEKTLSVTVSIGASQPSETLRTPALVIKDADEALYRAKKGGRNRVSV
jgi:diguanylate cyclase (GGDEF)-like protein